jgi:type II secretory pathway pseudopilin PulG
MVILAILAGVVVMAIGGVFGTSRERAYDVTKNELKNAVAQYASDNYGALPDLDVAVAINISECIGTCNIIDIDKLLVANNGILGKVPESCADDNGTGCAANDPDGSYTWAMDIYGNIYSACTGCDGAESPYTDGFQTIYP